MTDREHLVHIARKNIHFMRLANQPIEEWIADLLEIIIAKEESNDDNNQGKLPQL
jgi:hypothetical protein